MANEVRSRGAKRREALTQAAAELFWTRGYDATSLADIAALADVPLGNVYYYFKSKSDLALAVADLFVGETQALIDDVSKEGADPRARLRLLVRRLRDTQDMRIRHGCPIAMATRDFKRDAPEAAERASQSFTVLIGYIAGEFGHTGLRPSLSLARARAMICEWQGGIALAHALDEVPVLAEAFQRMDRLVTQPQAG